MQLNNYSIEQNYLYEWNYSQFFTCLKYSVFMMVWKEISSYESTENQLDRTYTFIEIIILISVSLYGLRVYVIASLRRVRNWKLTERDCGKFGEHANERCLIEVDVRCECWMNSTNKKHKQKTYLKFVKNLDSTKSWLLDSWFKPQNQNQQPTPTAANRTSARSASRKTWIEWLHQWAKGKSKWRVYYVFYNILCIYTF